jgi:hypothetical protein
MYRPLVAIRRRLLRGFGVVGRCRVAGGKLLGLRLVRRLRDIRFVLRLIDGRLLG